MVNTTPSTKLGATRDSESGASLHAKIVRRKLIENSITLMVFVALFAAFGLWLGSRFLNVDGRLLDVHSSVPVLLLGLAVLVTLVTGQFDLSVAGVATMSCFAVIGLTVKQDLPFPIVILAALGLGVAVGLINGFLIEYLKVNAFIATLGTGAVCTGLTAVYSGGSFIGTGTTGPQLPQWFTDFGSFGTKAPSALVWVGVIAAGAALFMALDRLRPMSVSANKWLGLKAAVVVALVLALVFTTWVTAISWMIYFLLGIAVVLGVLMRLTTYGRHIQAIGSNRGAALLAGVKVRRQVMKTFVLGGVLASIAGITLAAAQGSAAPDVASSFLLPAFAAAFLSTVVLSDGRFTVAGTILGGVFVVWAGLGLIVGGLQPTWVNVVNGLVLVVSVALSTAVRRRR